jgi:hypothetical protein
VGDEAPIDNAMAPSYTSCCPNVRRIWNTTKREHAAALAVARKWARIQDIGSQSLFPLSAI